MIKEPAQSVDEILDRGFSDTELTPLKDQLEPYLKGLGDGSRKYEGLESGFEQFDNLIDGLSRFVLLAGRGGVGKTSLALQVAIGICEIEQIPVIFYSFEMSRQDIITMLIQNKSRKLLRADIEKRGNAKDLPKERRAEIDKAVEKLKEFGERFYILDSSDKTPDLVDIEKQIEEVKRQHKSKDILIVLDSLQDIIPDLSGINRNMNQTQAEVLVAQKIVEIQQKTNATILAVCQKNKAGAKTGGYTSVYGSVSFIHKPTLVLEMIGGQEAIEIAKESGKVKPGMIKELEEAVMKNTKDPDTPYPVYLRIIKGRNCGYGGLAMKFYGAYRYYEVGETEGFDGVMQTIEEVGL